MARDTQKQRVYDSEDVIDKTTTVFKNVAEMQEFVDSILQARWFQSRWGRTRITVKDGRGRRNACGGYGVIKMPLWSRSRTVILHEVAHCLTPNHYAAHGPEFAGVFLFLVRQVMGAEAGAKLLESYRTKPRVRYNFNAVPKAGSRTVVTKTQREAAARAQRNRPVFPVDRRHAADIIQRAVKMNVFGPAGRKPRAHALETARQLVAGL
jgi:hypothetical protein